MSRPEQSGEEGAPKGRMRVLEKFNDISLLADLMGHESIETTRIYLRRTSTEQRTIVDKVVTW